MEIVLRMPPLKTAAQAALQSFRQAKNNLEIRSFFVLSVIVTAERRAPFPAEAKHAGGMMTLMTIVIGTIGCEIVPVETHN